MSGRIDKEIIDQVRNANDIVSVISEHMELKKKGQRYWGCCPFHNEKTPSFSVAPDKGFFYCFGCHAKGDVFSFLQQHENMSFMEALEQLAQRAGIALPKVTLTKEQMARQEQLDKLYEANQLAASFFHSCLVNTDFGKEALQYLEKRGLSRETIDRFQLGYAPAQWDMLHRALRKRGISDEILQEASLCRSNQGKVYDYFRNRVMFPIRDGKGRVLGFGGRVLDDSTPKYLNSPETSIFNKRRLLFGFDQAYKAIRSTKQAILVEGYMDVISAHNQGVTNVVASLGTAYTKEHGQLLLRQAEEIIIAYDMDGAGRTAAKRAIELLQNTSFRVRILAMPDGKDPDDYVRNHGAAAFQQLVKEAVRPFQYVLDEAMLHHDSTTLEGKEAILQEVMPFIAACDKQAQREDYLRSLALPLRLDYRTIVSYFNDFKGTGMVQVQEEAPVQAVKASSEDRLVALALRNEAMLSYVLQYVPLADIEQADSVALLTAAQQLWQQSGAFDVNVLRAQLSPELETTLVRLQVAAPETDDETVMNELIKAVRLRSLREQYKKHTMLADQLMRAKDPRFIEEMNRCQEINRLIADWSR